MPNETELQAARRDISEGEELVRNQNATIDALPPGQAREDAVALIGALEEELRLHRERLAKLLNSN